MDVAFQNWVTALSLGIVGGSLIGLVMGHKLKEPTARAIFSPVIFQSGSTNKALVVIGFALIAFAFFAGILQGIIAIVVGYITETIVGARVSNNNHRAGYSTVVKTILLMGLVVVLPVSLWGYHSYNRTPNDSDKLAFIYECDEYLANDIFKNGDSSDRDAAKATCACLWPDLVGRYHTIGKINEKVRNDGQVSISDSEVNAMGLKCLEDY